MQVPYDLLIGADGAGSVVRKALQQIMPPNFVRRFRNEQVYSIASVTVADPSEIPQHVVFTLHPLKVWVAATCKHALLYGLTKRGKISAAHCSDVGSKAGLDVTDTRAFMLRPHTPGRLAIWNA